MSKFKVGDRVRIVSNTYSDGDPYPNQLVVGLTGIITRLPSDHSDYYSVTLETEDKRKPNYELSERDLVLFEKTLDNLEIGDSISRKDSGILRTVIAIGPNHIGVQYFSDFHTRPINRIKTITSLKDIGYFYIAPTVKHEMTLAEIEKALDYAPGSLAIKPTAEIEGGEVSDE